MKTADSLARAKLSYLPHLGALLTLLACLAIYFQIRGATEQIGERTPIRYILPAGFVGNLKVVYEVDGAPDLPVEEGYRVIDVSPERADIVEGTPGVYHMRFETSSSAEYGHAVDVIERRTLDGGIEEITPQWIRDRKVGIEGDRKEFFEDAREIDERNARMEEGGLLGPDGEPVPGRPYEILIIRDNL